MSPGKIEKSHSPKKVNLQAQRDLKSALRCGEEGTLLHSWWDYELVRLLGKIVQRFLKKLKVGVPVVAQWK